jgi:hypothetical protein
MKMGNEPERKVVKLIPLIFIFMLIISIISVCSVSALTGSLGNSRMVLRVEAGDTIEKYILVKNVNDEEIKIGLRATGDLAEYIKLKENGFNLAPGEDKKAYFTIKVPTNGTTESRIEVTFQNASGKGNGVGLTSTIIVVAEEDSVNANLFEHLNTKTIILIATGLIFIILLILLFNYSKRKNKLKKSDETK